MVTTDSRDRIDDAHSQCTSEGRRANIEKRKSRESFPLWCVLHFIYAVRWNVRTACTEGKALPGKKEGNWLDPFLFSLPSFLPPFTAVSLEMINLPATVSCLARSHSFLFRLSHSIWSNPSRRMNEPTDTGARQRTKKPSTVYLVCKSAL